MCFLGRLVGGGSSGRRRSVGPVDQCTPCVRERGRHLVRAADRSNSHRPGTEHDQLLGDDGWPGRSELTQQVGDLAQQPGAMFGSDAPRGVVLVAVLGGEVRVGAAAESGRGRIRGQCLDDSRQDGPRIVGMLSSQLRELLLVALEPLLQVGGELDATARPMAASAGQADDVAPQPRNVEWRSITFKSVSARLDNAPTRFRANPILVAAPIDVSL